MKTALLLLVACLSCYTLTAQPKFEIVHHDSIPLTTADSIIAFDGRKVAIKNSRENAYYAALNPVYPMQQSVTLGHKAINTSKTVGCFKGGGGLIAACINYNVLINGDTVLISSPEKFREVFAPVNSPEEAIAFAYFFTNSEPMYNFDFLLPKPQPEPEYFTYYIIDSITHNVTDTVRRRKIVPMDEEWWEVYQPTITSSYAKKTDDGYELLLYFYTVFSCSHPYIERLIKVYTDGRVEIMEAKRAFEHSSMRGYCID